MCRNVNINELNIFIPNILFRLQYVSSLALLIHKWANYIRSTREEECERPVNKKIEAVHSKINIIWKITKILESVLHGRLGVLRENVWCWWFCSARCWWFRKIITSDVILTYWIILKTYLYHSYRKLFLFMSISIEIEKDLKMQVFLAKTKKCAFLQVILLLKNHPGKRFGLFFKMIFRLWKNNWYLKEILIFSPFFLVLILCK